MNLTAHPVEQVDTTLFAIRDAITDEHKYRHAVAWHLIRAVLVGTCCIDTLGSASWEVIGSLHADLFPTADDLERNPIGD